MWTRREIAIGLSGLALGIVGGLLLEDLWDDWDPVMPRWSGAAASGEPILILVVGSPTNVETVRRAVSADRILADSGDGFALRERRLVVGSVEDAGQLLMAADWRDEGIEILDLERSLPKDAGDGPELQSIADLVNKPTLSLAEARAVLQSM